jgi:hypothetical protein
MADFGSVNVEAHASLTAAVQAVLSLDLRLSDGKRLTKTVPDSDPVTLMRIEKLLEKAESQKRLVVRGNLNPFQIMEAESLVMLASPYTPIRQAAVEEIKEYWSPGALSCQA